MTPRYTRTISVPITETQADALEALSLTSGSPITDVLRTLIDRTTDPVEVKEPVVAALHTDPAAVILLGELLVIRRVLINGPGFLKTFDETKHRDAKLLLAGEPLPYPVPLAPLPSATTHPPGDSQGWQGWPDGAKPIGE